MTYETEKQLIKDVPCTENYFHLNLCKISRKLRIKERDYRNAASETLLKSLSAMDITL